MFVACSPQPLSSSEHWDLQQVNDHTKSQGCSYVWRPYWFGTINRRATSKYPSLKPAIALPESTSVRTHQCPGQHIYNCLALSQLNTVIPWKRVLAEIKNSGKPSPAINALHPLEGVFGERKYKKSAHTSPAAEPWICWSLPREKKSSHCVIDLVPRAKLLVLAQWIFNYLHSMKQLQQEKVLPE